MRRVSQSDKRRIFSTEVRDGEDIPETYLEFDEKTGKSRLGKTLEEERELNTGKAKAYMEKEIIQWFTAHPGTTFEKDCLPTIHGSSDTVRKVFKDMRRKSRVIRSGRGTKTSPFVFSMAELESEHLEAPKTDVKITGEIPDISEQLGEVAA